jgi:hypothetical protein
VDDFDEATRRLLFPATEYALARLGYWVEVRALTLLPQHMAA